MNNEVEIRENEKSTHNKFYIAKSFVVYRLALYIIYNNRLYHTTTKDGWEQKQDHVKFAPTSLNKVLRNTFLIYSRCDTYSTKRW